MATIEVPADLIHRAQERAANAGMTFEEWLVFWIERGIQDDADGSAAPPIHERPLPVIIPPRGRSMPPLSNAEIEAAELDDAS